MNAKLYLVFLIMFALICVPCGCSNEEPSQQTEKPQNTHADNSGESLATRLGVPECFQVQYVSEAGVSVLTADAKVVVPDVSSVNIIEAVPKAFTYDELLAFVARHYDEVKWFDHNTGNEYNGRGFEIDDAYDSKTLGYS